MIGAADGCYAGANFHLRHGRADEIDTGQGLRQYLVSAKSADTNRLDKQGYRHKNKSRSFLCTVLE